jgi:hypothetical protein
VRCRGGNACCWLMRRLALLVLGVCWGRAVECSVLPLRKCPHPRPNSDSLPTPCLACPLRLQSDRSALAASWDPFQDEETGVLFYSYQVLRVLQRSLWYCSLWPVLVLHLLT